MKVLKNHNTAISAIKYVNTQDTTIQFVSVDVQVSHFGVSTPHHIQGIMNVFAISKMLLMTVVEAQLLLNGSAGSISCLAAIPGEMTIAHPVWSLSLVAFCTSQKATQNKICLIELADTPYHSEPNVSKNSLQTGSSEQRWQTYSSIFELAKIFQRCSLSI
jgi:hypothetical protein